jgi:hypothetical protein
MLSGARVVRIATHPDYARVSFFAFVSDTAQANLGPRSDGVWC